jgi:(E)-4-hydroxy-3-methylbut-2-enyl-diphosphate synthase
MAEDIGDYIKARMPAWRDQYRGVEEMKVAVMGCVVNGPGESKHANIGISLPGTFEDPKAPVYVDGRLYTTLRGDALVAEFLAILDRYVEDNYASPSADGVASVGLSGTGAAAGQ